jgi:hypothetical protein
MIGPDGTLGSTRRRADMTPDRGTVSRWGCLLLLLLVVGGVGTAGWYFFYELPQQPKAYDKPVTTSASYAEGCGKFARRFFPDAAPYAAKGKRPVEIFVRSDGESQFHSAFLQTGTVPPHWRLRTDQYRQVQLIACAEQTDTGDRVKTCQFDEPEPITAEMRSADYRVIVYEARTGNEVGRAEIANGGQAVCPPIKYHRDGEDVELYSRPTAEQYRRAIGHFTD